MTIMLVSGSYPPRICGVGDYTARLARELSLIQPGNVVVLTSTQDDASSSVDDGITVRRAMPNWSLGRMRDLLRVVKEEEPDIIHFQYPTNGYGKGLTPWLAPLVTRLLGTPVVQTWHEGYSLRQTPTLLLKAAAPGRIIVVRPNYSRFIKPWLRWILRLKKYTYIESASTIEQAQLTPAQVAELRAGYPGDKKLLVFFGFVHADKGVERIFDLADPDQHYLVISGPIDYADDYCARIKTRSESAQWTDSSEITGALPPDRVARMLAIADAVVLPFEKGGGSWNTSIEAARLNGAFILTTSLTQNGYVGEEDIYYAEPGNVAEMAQALTQRLSGNYTPTTAPRPNDPWKRIAREHLAVYNAVLPEDKTFPILVSSTSDND